MRKQGSTMARVGSARKEDKLAAWAGRGMSACMPCAVS